MLVSLTKAEMKILEEHQLQVKRKLVEQDYMASKY
jgi:hypothetical protein